MKNYTKLKLWWWVNVVWCGIFIPIETYWMHTTKSSIFHLFALTYFMFIFVWWINNHYSKYKYAFKEDK